MVSNFERIATFKYVRTGKKNSSDNRYVKEIFTEYELIVDSCEQPRERPGEYEEQKKYYSGKKKNHTLKNQLIVLPDGRDIVDIVADSPGPKSDINLFRERQKGFGPKQKFNGDKGYAGEPFIKTPQNKPKNRQRSAEQKQKNKELSTERIVVEHLIRLVKIFQIAQERFRLKSRKYEEIILTIGLIFDF